jgi:putative membrane protein
MTKVTQPLPLKAVHCIIMGKKVFRMLLHWLATAGAVLLADWLLAGIHVDGFRSALIVSLVLGLLNVIVRPIIRFLSLPLIVLTLGLFLLVINALMLYFVEEIVPGFQVDGFWSALLGSLIISIVSSLFTGKAKVRTNRNDGPPAQS